MGVYDEKFIICTLFICAVYSKLCLNLKKKKETKIIYRGKQDLCYLGGFCKTLGSQIQEL